MDIYWKNEKLKKDLHDFSFLKKHYGEKVAEKVSQRLQELAMFPTYADLPINMHKHCVNNYFAVDLPNEGGGRGKWRLCFMSAADFDSTNQSTITGVIIIGIKNYHK